MRAITELTSVCLDIFETMLSYQHFQRDLVGKVNSVETGCVKCVNVSIAFLLQYFVVISGKTIASQHSHIKKDAIFNNFCIHDDSEIFIPS